MATTNRRNDPLRQTLVAPVRTARLAAATLSPASTLPALDEASYEALCAMRDDVLAEVYCSVLRPA